MGRAKVKDFLPYVLLVVLVMGVYAGSLRGGFAYDDYSTVVENPIVKSAAGLKYFLSSRYYGLFGEQSYRPVVTLSYFVDYAVWKLRPLGWHLTNVLLHAAMVLLVFGVGREVLKNEAAAFLGAGLYAVHPVLTEAVNGIGFREDLLAGVFYAGALLLYLKVREKNRAGLFFWCVVCFALGLLSKEMAVTLPAVILVYELVFMWGRRRERAGWVGFLFALAMVYAGLRLSVLRDPNSPGDRYPEESFVVNALTMPGVFARYAGLFLVPVGQSVHYFIKPVRSILAPWAMLGMAAVGAYAAALVMGMRWDRKVGFGIAWFGLTLIPVSNLVPIANVAAERYLYLPTAAYALVAGGLLVKARGWRGGRVAGSVAAAVLLPALAVGTVMRNRDWADEVRLWEGAVKRFPDSTRAHAYLGAAYSRKDDYETAVREFREAIALHTEKDATPAAMYNLGQGLKALDRLDEAAEAFKKYVEVFPGNFMGHTSLGVTYLMLGQPDMAKGELERALELNPDDYIATADLGLVYEKRNQLDEAIGMYRKALELAPTKGTFHGYMASALLKKGLMGEGKRELDAAVKLSGDDAVVLLDVGRKYMEINELGKAEWCLLRALEVGGRDRRVVAALGNLYLKMGVPVKARGYLEEAVAEDQSDVGSLYWLGLAYESMGEWAKAKGAYERILEVWDGELGFAEKVRDKLKGVEGKVP